MHEDLHRRSEDQDRSINLRLDRTEEAIIKLNSCIITLENTIGTVKTEQSHVKELMFSRLSAIESSQALQLSETKHISVVIQSMANDADRTPMGRALIKQIEGTEQEQLRFSSQIEKSKGEIASIITWKNQVDGVLNLLKWIGLTGIAGLVITMLRMFKFLP